MPSIDLGGYFQGGFVEGLRGAQEQELKQKEQARLQQGQDFDQKKQLYVHLVEQIDQAGEMLAQHKAINPDSPVVKEMERMIAQTARQAESLGGSMGMKNPLVGMAANKPDEFVLQKLLDQQKLETYRQQKQIDLEMRPQSDFDKKLNIARGEPELARSLGILESPTDDRDEKMAAIDDYFKAVKSGDAERAKAISNAYKLGMDSDNKTEDMGEFKQFQLDSARYAFNMKDVVDDLSAMDNDEEFTANTGTIQFLEQLPLLGLGPAAARYLRTDEQQQYFQKAQRWIRSKLRDESGATIGDQEMFDEYTTFFPMPGDDSNVIKQKALARKRATEAMVEASGGAYDAMAKNINKKMSKDVKDVVSSEHPPDIMNILKKYPVEAK